MKLTVLIEDQTLSIEVDQPMLESAMPLFDNMDRDMDKGWKLGRYFIEQPNTLQRCQAVADRLLTAIHAESTASMTLMAGYILHRLDNVKSVNINAEGEAHETMFYDHHNALISWL